MSGETEQDISAFTVDSLHVHLKALINERDRRYEQRFEAQEQAVEAALASAEKAVHKAEQASEKRFEAVNEFRATLADQASHFISRTETMARADANAEKIDALASRLDKLEGSRGGMKDSWGYLVGAVGFAATIVSIVVLLTR